MHCIDLLDLTSDCNTELIVEDILQQEPNINKNLKTQLLKLVQKLQRKLLDGKGHTYNFFKELKAHILPLTIVAFNKDGSKFITGSYDRTCKVWSSESAEQLLNLKGHENVVFTAAFNNPYGNIIATGSFDKTARIWNSENGLCCYKLEGHSCEVVCLDFSTDTTLFVTGSLDNQAYLWDVTTGKFISALTGHTEEVISVSFSSFEQLILTGSFDGTARLWDCRTRRCCLVLTGHLDKLSKSIFNWNSTLIATSSFDTTSCLWDPRSGHCLGKLIGHNDEVQDIAFDMTGKYIATASTDETAIIYNALTRECISKLEGHRGEVSKKCSLRSVILGGNFMVKFSPEGSMVLTASADCSARIWDPFSGICQQTLIGHCDEILSCEFNYLGDTIITGGKDNKCCIWK